MPRILIIEDDEQVRVMLRMTFEAEGYDVDTATDGKDGLRCYREHPPDLVITDLIMPEKEGLETIMELINQNPEVKIIAISGGGRISAEGYLDVAADLGAVRTFSKPVPRDKLVRAVAEIIGK